MAPSESIILRAKAKSLNIAGYKQMSMDELRAAVAGSDNGAEATVAKTNTSKRKSTGRKSAKGVAKKATTAKPAPAKSTKRKPAKRKSAAAKKGTAKRQATGKAKPAVKRGRAKVTTAKRKSTTAKKRGTAKARSTQRKVKTLNAGGGRQMIDETQIDWTAESSVGNDAQSNRGIIMKLLRSKKGNVQKVFDALADKAKSMYPKTEDGRARSKDAAQTLLRWHIGRTRFDFVKSSGQHPEADNPAYAKAARKRFGKAAPRKRAGASRKAAPAKGRAKTTTAKRGPQKGARKRTGGGPRGSQRAKTAAARKRGR